MDVKQLLDTLKPEPTIVDVKLEQILSVCKVSWDAGSLCDPPEFPWESISAGLNLIQDDYMKDIQEVSAAVLEMSHNMGVWSNSAGIIDTERGYRRLAQLERWAAQQQQFIKEITDGIYASVSDIKRAIDYMT